MFILFEAKLENLGATVQIEESTATKKFYSVLMSIPARHLHCRMRDMTWSAAKAAVEALGSLDSIMVPRATGG